MISNLDTLNIHLYQLIIAQAYSSGHLVIINKAENDILFVGMELLLNNIT